MFCPCVEFLGSTYSLLWGRVDVVVPVDVLRIVIFCILCGSLSHVL